MKRKDNHGSNLVPPYGVWIWAHLLPGLTMGEEIHNDGFHGVAGKEQRVDGSPPGNKKKKFAVSWC